MSTMNVKATPPIERILTQPTSNARRNLFLLRPFNSLGCQNSAVSVILIRWVDSKVVKMPAGLASSEP